MFGILGIESRQGVWGWCVLCSGAVGGLLPGMGSMLGTCWCRMAEALEGTLDVAWNGNVDSLVDIIPINGETTISVSGPVLADDV